MHPAYSDIVNRLGKPLWWYHHKMAVPRYDEFHPSLLGVYDKWAALCVIRCQCCRVEMKVSVSLSDTDRIRFSGASWTQKEIKLPSQDDPGSFDKWNDPPIHDDCDAGNTMCSEFVRIEQFWVMTMESRTENYLEWVRHPECELDYSKMLED